MNTATDKMKDMMTKLEAVNDKMDELGETLTALLPPMGLEDAQAARGVCAVLAAFHELRSDLRAATAELYAAAGAVG